MSLRAFAETTRSLRARRMDTLEALYAGMEAMDGEATARNFTHDCQFRFVGNPVLNPHSGLRVGRQGVAQLMRMLSRDYRYERVRLVDVIFDQDAAAALIDMAATAHASGRSLSAPCLDHLTFDGDLVASFTGFTDAANFARIMDRGP